MLNVFSKKPRPFPFSLSLQFAKIKEGGSIALYGILFSCLFLFVTVSRPAFFPMLDKKLYDVMHRYLPDYGTPLPLIVDIDDKSLAEVGQWPWPRYQLAHLLEKLAASDAASVGMDIIFAESDRISLKEVQRELREWLDFELNLEGIPDRLHDNDAILADVLAHGPHVLGYKFLASGDGKPPRGLLPMNVIILRDSRSPEVTVDLPSATGVVGPLPVLAKAIRGSGFINVMPDNGGVVRRIPLLMRFQDQIYPSLALASVMQAINAERVFLKASALGVESLRLNETVIVSSGINQNGASV